MEYVRKKQGLTISETYTFEKIGQIMLNELDCIQMLYNFRDTWQSFEREEMLNNLNKNYIKLALSDYHKTKTNPVKMKLKPEIYSKVDATGSGLFSKDIRIAYTFYPWEDEEDSIISRTTYANSNNWPIKAIIDTDQELKVNDMRFLQTDNDTRIVMVADIGTWMIPTNIILPSGKEQMQIAHMFIVIDGIINRDVPRYRQEFKGKVQSVFPKFNDYTFDTMWSKLKTPQW